MLASGHGVGPRGSRLETEEQRAILKSVGSAVPGVEVMIRDEDGREVDTGQEGEIWIRGGNTIAGYYKDPEQTKANFSENGFWKSATSAIWTRWGASIWWTARRT